MKERNALIKTTKEYIELKNFENIDILQNEQKLDPLNYVKNIPLFDIDNATCMVCLLVKNPIKC